LKLTAAVVTQDKSVQAAILEAFELSNTDEQS
jgi:hypothetical protein